MTLAEALGAQAGDVVSFIGAGGKTTAMFRVADDLAARGLRVIVTTTTKIFPPEQPDVALIVKDEGGDALGPRAAAALGRRRVVVVVARRLPDGKLQGIQPEEVGELLGVSGVAALLVEADGSARKPFKAPADHEPVIPRETTLLVAVIGADALDQPLSADVAHRPERVAEQAGIRMGDPITPAAAARVMLGEANLRGKPAGARLAALIARAGTGLRRAPALELARRLGAGGVSPVVLAELVTEPGCIEPVSGHVLSAGRAMSTRPAAPLGIVAGVILAAGESRRMGQFKLLLPWRGRPVLDHVLRAVRASELPHRILVLGHRAGAVRAALDLDDFTVCENPDYLLGQSTSMRVGLAAAPAECSGFLFLLGDQPAITPGFINGMAALHGVRPDRILVPTIAGRRTSPVLFPARLRDALLAVRGDQGGRPVLDAHPDLIVPVPVDDPALLRDLDAPSDLESP